MIPANVDYVGDSNNVRYYPDSQVIAASGEAVSTVTAETPGVIGNLNEGDTLTIGTQIAGATTTATVTVGGVINIGAEEEDEETYRERVLFAIRSTSGGGNATDYKTWAEEVAGVVAAYPYSGTPSSPAPGIDASSVPADRTIFIEVDSSIDADGIAPTSILDEVREVVNNDPDTGIARPPLGLTDDTLYVESIVRTSVDVTITNFSIIDSALETQVKSDISTALTEYFLSIKMYVPAVDLLTNRNDKITDLSVGKIIQDILSVNNASAEEVALDIGGAVNSYQLSEGELAKLGTITYA